MDIMEKTNLLTDEACGLPTKVGEGFFFPSLLGIIGRTSTPKGATQERHEIPLRKLRDAYGTPSMSGLFGATGAICFLVGATSTEAVGHLGGGAMTGNVGSGVLLPTMVTETEKTTVASVSEELPVRTRVRRRKAAPKAVALLERFKHVPSVDPHLFRSDIDRILDPGL